MKKHILFLHGGAGKEDYEADQKMVSSLQSELGASYHIHYPLMPQEELPDFGRLKQIDEAVSKAEPGLIVVAHSLGASMLLRYLSERKLTKTISAVFLLATPYWEGKEDWVKPLELKKDFEKQLNKDIPLFFYHCRDDEEVPFAQFEKYKRVITWAAFREIKEGGHQFDKGLKIVTNDITR